MRAISDGPTLVVIGGVPGAGKSTAIEAELRTRSALVDAGDSVEVRALDSDQVRRWLAGRVPSSLPYATYRPIVHSIHVLRVLAWLVLGPRRAGVRLIVHDPCTRPGRLRALARIARRHGWQPALVLVDARRGEARAGQLSRGRVLDSDNFERHWRRWLEIRQDHPRLPGWVSVDLVTRSEAAPTLSALVDGSSDGSPGVTAVPVGPERACA